MIADFLFAVCFLGALLTQRRGIFLTCLWIGIALVSFYSLAPFGLRALTFVVAVSIGRWLFRIFDASTTTSVLVAVFISFSIYAGLETILWMSIFHIISLDMLARGGLFAVRAIFSAALLWVTFRGVLFGVLLMRYAMVEERIIPRT